MKPKISETFKKILPLLEEFVNENELTVDFREEPYILEVTIAKDSMMINVKDDESFSIALIMENEPNYIRIFVNERTLTNEIFQLATKIHELGIDIRYIHTYTKDHLLVHDTRKGV